MVRTRRCASYCVLVSVKFFDAPMSGVMCNKAVQPSPAIAKRGCSLEAQIIDGYRLALAVRRQCRFVSFDALLKLQTLLVARAKYVTVTCLIAETGLHLCQVSVNSYLFCGSSSDIC